MENLKKKALCQCCFDIKTPHLIHFWDATVRPVFMELAARRYYRRLSESHLRMRKWSLLC